MTILAIIALLGLIIFALSGLVWLFSPSPRRPQVAIAALIGLLTWAIATIVITFVGLA
jgi:hypothetical protein